MGSLTDRTKQFGKSLIDAEIITSQQWEEVLREYEATKKSVGEIIIDKGFASAEDSRQLLELFYGVPYMKLSEYILEREALDMVSEEFCRKYKVIPMNLKEDKLTVALIDPDDVVTTDNLRQATGKNIQVVLASEDDIIRAIDMYYVAGSRSESMLERLGRIVEQIDLSDRKSELKFSEETPIVKLVNDILIKAIRSNASDIHVEPTRDELLIRLRVDGILRVFLSVPLTLHPGVISRIKIMGGMNITEKRLPQDGRAEIKARNRIIDLRISSVPSIFGEKIVVRILDKKLAILNMEQLGFYEDNLKKVYKFLEHSFGMIIICGPTGSGKTSTSYSICNRIKTIEKNIISIEDPVEYQIDQVVQIQVNHDIGLGFAKVLRSILRQDPDIILVGEIRDLETADMAVHAALTGHLVVSTLHTNDSAASVVRLIDMGIPPYLVTSAVRGVIAQRLVRKICPSCKEEHKPKPGQWEAVFGMERIAPDAVYRGKGCDICFHSGYFGRTAISEVMILSDKLRNIILSKPDTGTIINTAREEGLITLLDEAAIKVAVGKTTLEEVIRVNL